jgi:secretion/DNA translocation related CpaE-like protein
MSLPPAPAVRPLVVSTDEQLLDDVLRVLAAAGAEPEVATGGPVLRRAHREAPLVLFGPEALATGAVRALPRRPGVVVVARGELPAAGWAAAVEVGAERVVVLPDDEAWLLSRAAGAARPPVERGWLAAVGAGCGGAGASTLAVALALTAAEAGAGALLVDADPCGGGLDLLLGAEGEDGVRWPDLTGLRGRVSGTSVLAALPESRGVHVLAASRETPAEVPGEALMAVVQSVREAGLPVVVDLPRTGSSGTAVLDEADLLALVVPARLRAACAARALVAGPGGAVSAWAGAQLVLRRVPGGLTREDVVRVVGRPVVAEVPHDRGSVGRAERGEPPAVSGRSPWGRATRQLLGLLPDAGAR